MKLKPLYDRVVLKPEKIKEMTDSGIMLPEMSQEKSQIAKVIAVGEGGDLNGKEQKIQVKKDDKVLFNQYAGTEIVIDGEKYIIIRQVDILAIVGGE